MKKSASLITYLSALVIGIILLALHEQVNLLKGIVIAIGVLITVPSAIMFLSPFFSRKNSEGLGYASWLTVLVAAAGLVLGIWMLVMPSFFETAMIYTLGVILILVGAAQVVFIFNASRPYGANPLWYCVPVLVIAGGFIVLFIGPKGVNSWATITTGILLIVYSANGLSALGRECKVDRERKQLGESDSDTGELSD
ncbi:MAG: DUF308 domain-containing protein [Muribaculaceae bacterium]|nr:DUF308 domain-containing protein [Muribaculaceae bacterium]